MIEGTLNIYMILKNILLHMDPLADCVPNRRITLIPLRQFLYTAYVEIMPE